MPLTSDLSEVGVPTRVLITSSEGGLEKDSLAVCENISAILKANLSDGPYGSVSKATLTKIQKAIAIAIDYF